MIDLRCRIMEGKYARSAFGQRKRFRPASLLFRQYEPTKCVHELAKRLRPKWVFPLLCGRRNMTDTARV